MQEKLNGPKGTYTANTAVVSDRNGVIIWTSMSMPGRMHGITVVRKHRDQLNKMFAALRRKLGKKITILADKGYQGLYKEIPNAVVLTPHKEYKNRTLTPEQKRHNERVNRNRMPVEGDIHGVKMFGAVNGPFKGRLITLTAIFNITAGLANMRKIKMKKWAVVWKKYK